MEHKLILGGAEYLPFARSRVKALRATGLMYASQQFEVNGVQVKVRIEGPHEYITLGGGGYMESGILDLHHVWLGEVGAYKPATIKMTPFVLSHKSSALPDAGSRPVKNGDDSWSAAGCSSKITVINRQISELTTVHFESPAEAPAFCDSADVQSKKLLMESIPASTYTGKMRLFVQALYGSRRTDYKAGGLLGSFLDISTHTFTVPTREDVSPAEIYVSLINGYPTTGLMTVADSAGKPKYILIDVGTESVTYRAMLPRGAATPTKTGLGEAYVLSTLVPSATVKTAAGPNMLTTMRGRSPLAYGWHFSFSGTQASIVVREGKVISGRKYATNDTTTIGGFRFEQLKLEFAYDAAHDTVSYSIESVLIGDHIPYLQTRTFFPVLSAQNMMLLQPFGGTAGSWDCWTDLTAPLYCYYNADDALITVIATNSTPVNIAADSNNSTLAAITGTPYVSLGAFEYHSLPSGVSLPEAGVSVGDTPYRGGGLDYYGPVVHGKFFFAGTSVMVNVPYPSGLLTPVIDINTTSGSWSYDTTKSSEGKATSSIFVIPFGDASAVIAGVEHRTIGTYTGNTIYSGVGNNCYVTNIFTGNPALWTDYVWPFANSLTPAQEEEIRKTQTPSPSSLISTTRLHPFSGAPIELGSANAVGYDNSFAPTRPYEGLYNVAGYAAPYYDYPMTVKSSYSGALQHLYCMSPVDPVAYYQCLNGWPNVRWSAAVGWA